MSRSRRRSETIARDRKRERRRARANILAERFELLSTRERRRALTYVCPCDDCLM